MGSLPPRARLFAAFATITGQVLFLAVIAIPAVSGATTNKATSGTQLKAARTVHRSTVQGTVGNDTIITKRRAQRVLALAGDDYVRLGSAGDLAYGDTGNDWLHGNDGRAAVYGGPGNDHPQGGTGHDYVSGGGGDDELDGDAGNDRIFAGAGNDSITGDEGDDVIYPGPGADEVFGEEGDNKIVATDDGVRDDIFCNQIVVPAPPGIIVYIGHRDPLDALRNCKVVIK
jgi:Ca2+-binding RTX toxin-like protein